MRGHECSKGFGKMPVVTRMEQNQPSLRVCRPAHRPYFSGCAWRVASSARQHVCQLVVWAAAYWRAEVPVQLPRPTCAQQPVISLCFSFGGLRA